MTKMFALGECEGKMSMTEMFASRGLFHNSIELDFDELLKSNSIEL